MGSCSLQRTCLLFGSTAFLAPAPASAAALSMAMRAAPPLTAPGRDPLDGLGACFGLAALGSFLASLAGDACGAATGPAPPPPSRCWRPRRGDRRDFTGAIFAPVPTAARCFGGA